MSRWLSVEYSCRSVDIRTYCAARVTRFAASSAIGGSCGKRHLPGHSLDLRGNRTFRSDENPENPEGRR